MATTAPRTPPKLTNVYYHRRVGTAKTCWICHRETTVCLANADVSDFFYICPSHLNDPGFAKADPTVKAPSSGTSSPAPVEQSEIDKVKAEYEEKLKRKGASNADDKDKDKEEKGKGWMSTASEFGTFVQGAWKAATAEQQQAAAATPATPPQPATAYNLHRDIFAMRTDQARRRYQAQMAQERAKSFPSAPNEPVTR